MSSRIGWVDCAKGIGILLVVYGHVARGVSTAGLMDGEGSFQFVDSLIYSFHMPLFFFLSGMFFLNSYRKTGMPLITNKFVVLIYPYVIWSVLQTGVKIVMGGHTNHPAQLHDFVTILWLPVEQFWFLYSLFMIFVFESICFSTLRKLDRSEQTCIVLIGMVSLGLFFLRPLLPGVFQVQTVAEYMVYFHGGICFTFFTKEKELRGLVRIPLLWLLLFASCAAVHQLWWENSVVLPLLLAFSGTMIVITLSHVLLPPIFTIFSYLGKFSMEIYLIHILAASGFRIILVKVFQTSSLSLHLAGGLTFGLLIPILFAKMTEKHPLGALFFSLPSRLRR
jgi:fucose 4-O-acetylase-like acetyltransferase